jgi:hypothetical protein
MKPVAIALGVTLILIPVVAEAQDGWRLLGQKVVTDRVDRDVITVPGGKRDTQIRFCVQRRAVRLYDVNIRFANGGYQDVPVQALIAAGKCSRIVDLRYRDRNIATVNFTYEAKSLGHGQAEVRLYAK